MVDDVPLITIIIFKRYDEYKWSWLFEWKKSTENDEENKEIGGWEAGERSEINK